MVSFLEGDPDRPLITGVVYNADQMPPYTLPDKKTKSCIKTNSSKGGDGFNEIRFDDAKGNEQIYIHGQKDMDTAVVNNETIKIGSNRTGTVGIDESVTINGNHTESIGKDSSISVGKDLSILGFRGQFTLTVGAASVSIKSDGTIAINGMDISINSTGQISQTAALAMILKGQNILMKLTLYSAHSVCRREKSGTRSVPDTWECRLSLRESALSFAERKATGWRCE